MYEFKVEEKLEKVLHKIFKKDSQLHQRIIKKMKEIVNSDEIEHYKNLRHNMKDRKRVHVGHFVLVFRFIKSENKILFIDFDHHDNVY